MTTVCGIDYGTSNTVLVAYLEDGPPKVIKSVQGESLHPSAIYYPPNSKEPPVIGKAALSYLPSENVILQPKRAIGATFKLLKEKGFLDVFNCKVFVPKTEKAQTAKVKFLVQIDGKLQQKKVETVILDMLRTFVQLVENDLGKKDQVAFVFSRPQFWGVDQTSTFKKAVEEAVGKNRVVDIITEPTGGQFAYSGLKPPGSKSMMTVDVGAGTYDLSMLREKSPGNFVGITTGGDDLLGGNNIEIEFLRELEKELRKMSSFNQSVFDQQRTTLLIQLKELKHQLSLASSANLMVYGCSAEGYQFKMNREKSRKILEKPFYQVISKRTKEMFDRKTANLPNLTSAQLMSEVEIIFPIGGPHRDPFIMEEIIQPLFPKALIIGMPGSTGAHNPDEVVALGNAMWGAAKLSTPAAKKVGLPQPVHVNVLSRSIGVEGISRENNQIVSHFCVVIEGNTLLPTCKMKEGFSTSVENQKEIRISVFQGEGKFTSDDGMQSLGEFSITMNVPNKVDGPMINVEMEVTPDNILIVRAGEEGNMKMQTFDEVH